MKRSRRTFPVTDTHLLFPGESVTHNGWKSFEDAFKRSFKISGNQEEEKEEKKLPELSEGQAFDGVQTKISEHFTSPPKHFTEDLLLSAMERAGQKIWVMMWNGKA